MDNASWGGVLVRFLHWSWGCRDAAGPATACKSSCIAPGDGPAAIPGPLRCRHLHHLPRGHGPRRAQQAPALLPRLPPALPAVRACALGCMHAVSQHYAVLQQGPRAGCYVTLRLLRGALDLHVFCDDYFWGCASMAWDLRWPQQSAKSSRPLPASQGAGSLSEKPGGPDDKV